MRKNKTVTQDPILQEFKAQLQQELGGNLKQVILFGSRARGDHQADSDYDVAVVVGRLTHKLEEKISDISGDFFYNTDIPFSTFPVKKKRFESEWYNPWFNNIKDEGIAI